MAGGLRVRTSFVPVHIRTAAKTSRRASSGRRTARLLPRSVAQLPVAGTMLLAPPTPIMLERKAANVPAETSTATRIRPLAPGWRGVGRNGFFPRVGGDPHER